MLMSRISTSIFGAPGHAEGQSSKTCLRNSMFAPPALKVKAPWHSVQSTASHAPQTTFGRAEPNLSNQAVVRLLPQRTAYPERCKSAERSTQVADQEQKASPRTTAGASWNFGKISIVPPDASGNASQVWLAGSHNQDPEALKKDTEESRDVPEKQATFAEGQRMAAEPRPVSSTMLQHVAERDGAFVSGPPVGTSRDKIIAMGGAKTLGWTPYPSEFKAPDFDFNTAMGAGAGAASGLNWTCDPILRNNAFEGNADSFYTSAGKYRDVSGKESGKDVYLNFSPSISSLIQAGEQEHCDDHAEAYKISLQEAESVLKQNVVGKTFGPAASASDAENLVLQAIDDKLTHKALGSDKAKWAYTYRTLFEKTKIRDTSKWHTLATGARTETSSDITYEIIQGAAQVGSHPSSSIIKY
jgi:hypothetical protein